MTRGTRSALDWTNWTMGAVFLVSAVLQYNDPDPLGWAAIYGAAGVVCLGAGRPARAAWILPAAVGVAALGWAAWLAPAVLPALALGDLFRSMKADRPAIEEGRELLGLLIVASWMGVLLVRGSRAGRSARGPTGHG